MNSKTSVGRSAEDRAAKYLQGQGYTIITRNFHIRGGEIDIIALDGEVVVFVEVRWRADDLAEESIGPSKAESLRRTASVYLLEMGEEREYRFDLLAMSPKEIRLHRDFLS